MLKRWAFRRRIAIPAVLMGIAALTVVAIPSAASAAGGNPLINHNSGLCMTNGGNTGNSAPIQQYTCKGNAPQAWILNGNSIVNQDSGDCLTNGGATGNNAAITQYPCNNSANQHWHLAFINGNYQEIENGAGMCMTTGEKTGLSTPIVQYTCNQSLSQQWLYG